MGKVVFEHNLVISGQCDVRDVPLFTVSGELSAEGAGQRSPVLSLLPAPGHRRDPVRQRDDRDAE